MKCVVLVLGAIALAGCNGGTVDRHALTKDSIPWSAVIRIEEKQIVVRDDTHEHNR